MGLTIYYEGNFKRDASLSEMIDEIKGISEVNKWTYHIFEEAFPENSFDKEHDDEIYGICFSPEEKCEPVWLTFISTGRMCSPFLFDQNNISPDKQLEEAMYSLFTKTQYAGVETHKIIIHLLRYIGKKYLDDFKVIDEGQYWETGDEKVLKENFRRFTAAIQTFTSALENAETKAGESTEEAILRIFKEIQDKKKLD